MEKIEIKGSIGDEVALVYNGKALVVKLSEDGIVPDFVNILIKAMNVNADGIIHSAMRVYHKYPNADIIAREKLGVIRDAIFETIVATSIKQEEEQEAKTKRSTRKAKTDPQEQSNE